MAAVQTTLNSGLENIVRSYARLSRDVGGRIVFACDLDNEAALSVAEQEKNHLDQAFFVLSFAALENQITTLACSKEGNESRRMAMRGADFEKRWDVALRVAEATLKMAIPWASARTNVLSWYKIRSDIAHGRSPSAFADVAALLRQAGEIANTIAQVLDVLAAPHP